MKMALKEELKNTVYRKNEVVNESARGNENSTKKQSYLATSDSRDKLELEEDAHPYGVPSG